MRSTKIVREDEKYVTYLHKYHLGDIGDQAFEWDLDGSQREAWNKKVDQWEKEGILGRQEEVELTLVKCPFYDNTSKPDKLSNYSFTILDFSRYE